MTTAVLPIRVSSHAASKHHCFCTSLQEFLAVVVNMSISLRSAGCGHLVLHSIGGEPQLALHNATPHAVKHRENVPRAMW